MGLWYLKDTGFELTAFSDLDHAGWLDSRKSTSSGIQFLGGDKLVSWLLKKQDYYGFHFDKIPMYCDSKAAIAISCNPVQRSRTKHINVRYHFIKEKVQKVIVELFFVETEYQLAYLFTKALPVERFKYLVRRLGMRCLTPAELEDNPHQTLKRKGIVDSGCLRHMIGNKAYLVEYQDFNGGLVAFGGSKGQITGKGKIKTGKLDFEDVYFVKELHHFNLFSVSQICDKKNKVLFTDIECLVLSLDFKLPDENQVLLRVPRQNNMYSFNIKNIVPSGGLACLIAKVTVDESNKWNKRFSWVLFLRTKDETSGIFKDFIRQIENQLNQQVKTIRCDNGTEIKTRDIIEFYASKRIMREYSNARTSQQNRVAERKNMTLIKAARTMLADSFLPNTFWAEAVSTTCYILNRELVTKPQNKTPYELLTGLKEANNSAGTQDNIDAGNSKMEAEHAQEYFVLPLWFSYTSNVKSSESKNGDEKLCSDTGSKTNKEPVDQEDQAFLEELARIKRQAKEADDAAETLRKTFSKNDSQIPSLKDIYEVPNDRIFLSSSYHAEGVVADFINLESTMNGHSQEEGIDYDEMNVKSTFLYGKIDEEVYVCQPLGFIDPKFLKKVYKVVKALYGLHQAPRAWYPNLSTFLVKSGYRRGIIDKTMFIKKDKKDIMLVQVYVDDIMFGSTKKSWCDEFEALIKSSFQMSSMGQLTFFLRLQTASTPIETKKPLVKDAEATDMDVYLYRSMIGSLMYLHASRHDIIYAFCACSRFYVTPKTSYLHVVNGIFKYLKGQPKLEGVTSETLSTTTLAVSTVSVQLVLLCCFENQEAKIEQTATGKETSNLFMAGRCKVSNEFKFIKEQISVVSGEVKKQKVINAVSYTSYYCSTNLVLLLEVTTSEEERRRQY
nr:hypothetical protein [Tanacetum cinerariifolium]